MFEFFRFELRQQLRSPVLWLLGTLVALVAFAALTTDAVQVGGAIGNVHRNAPRVVIGLSVAFSLIGMLFVAMSVHAALLRDFELGTAELIFASPIRRRDFVLGRIGAAVVACLCVYGLIVGGMFLAQFMPWVDPARLGPATIAPYAWSLAVIVLPNLLFSAALLSLLALLTRSILWVYIGVLGFLVLYGVGVALLGDLDNVNAVALWEPLGRIAFARTVRYWSAEEMNTLLPALDGMLLANRLLWTALSLALFGVALALFRPLRSGTGRGLLRRRAAASQAAEASVGPVPARIVAAPSTGARAAFAQFMGQLRFDAAGVFRGIPFVIMLLFALANFVPNALFASTLYDTPVHPVTSQMVTALQQSYSFVLMIIVLFYAGELFGRARAAKTHEVVDAMPTPDWVAPAAKFGALVLVVFAFQLFGGLTAIAIQLAKGHVAIEPLVYLRTLAVDSIVYLLMAGLALSLQAYANNKFVGYGLMILFLAVQPAMSALDLTHNLYNYGSAPNARWSDMNGYGHLLAPQLWFQTYWGLCMTALLLVAAALWVRGTGGSWRERLRLGGRRLRGPLGVALTVTVLAWAGVGGWIFWNTNVRNHYRTPDEQLDLQARYEREYARYRNLPQPKILAADIDVDLHPETQSMVANGTYRVHNPHATPIRDVHIAMIDDESLTSIDLGGAELVHHDADAGYRIYRLAKPLAPGEERTFRFRVTVAPKGFTNDGVDTKIVDNGTFFNNTLFPSFGYNEEYQIGDRNERRKRNLGEPKRMPKLEDVAARQYNPLSDDADWIDFRTTLCTAPDQIALSPGYLVREYRNDAGRRCFRYEMDRPMLNFYAFLSGRWQVRRGAYKGVPIEIYYDPKHAYNVDRMVAAVQRSLAYYESNFTPYQHRQVRIIEFPQYARFAQSFANTIPFSESIGFIADLGDADDIDYVSYVTAHEVAHQWWGHQVVGANVQGWSMLIESLAQYSSLMVMEKEYGRGKMRKFLRYELDRYLAGRAGEVVEEQPLYRVENQQYIHYQKGSLAFYRLREEIGEDALNRALRRFLHDNAFQSPPYTTTRALLDDIRAEAGPGHEALITDLFEKIAFYDNRLEAATAKKRADGKYEVTLDLRAAKRYADGKGRESPGRLDDWIEVAVYAKASSGKEADQKPLYLQRQHVTAERTTLRIVVDGEPYEAGFDPDNKLIDRVPADNRRKIDL